jgi:hypothetical protein
MHDPIQRLQLGGPGQDFFPKACPVQRAVLLQHVIAESCCDRCEGRVARRLSLADQLVSVDDRGAPAAEQLHNGGLAGSDVSRQGD